MNSVSYFVGLAIARESKWVLNQLSKRFERYGPSLRLLLSFCRTVPAGELLSRSQSSPVFAASELGHNRGTSDRTYERAKMLCSQANQTFALFSLEKMGVSRNTELEFKQFRPLTKMGSLFLAFQNCLSCW